MHNRPEIGDKLYLHYNNITTHELDCSSLSRRRGCPTPSPTHKSSESHDSHAKRSAWCRPSGVRAARRSYEISNYLAYSFIDHLRVILCIFFTNIIFSISLFITVKFLVVMAILGGNEGQSIYVNMSLARLTFRCFLVFSHPLRLLSLRSRQPRSRDPEDHLHL